MKGIILIHQYGNAFILEKVLIMPGLLQEKLLITQPFGTECQGIELPVQYGLFTVQLCFEGSDGRTVIIIVSEDDDLLSQGRQIMENNGAESLDAAREKWWIGLRDSERTE